MDNDIVDSQNEQIHIIPDNINKIYQILGETPPNHISIDNITRKHHKLFQKVKKNIDKIQFSLGQLGAKKCYYCGKKINVENLYKFKTLNYYQLEKLNEDINNYINNTYDLSLDISCKVILILLVFLIIPIFLSIYNMYIIHFILQVISIFLIFPIIYTLICYKKCNQHDLEGSSTRLDTIVKNVITGGVLSHYIYSKEVWSCKYANKLAYYVESRLNNLLNTN